MRQRAVRARVAQQISQKAHNFVDATSAIGCVDPQQTDLWRTCRPMLMHLYLLVYGEPRRYHLAEHIRMT